ncbi:unnamed protein product [Sphagnum jensenii]|uniref:Uncharacterized protein n=1 Tax=Sphagnum jensenii TaxID=128206 RepID=A0ABP0XJ65_9BRYO
MFAKRYGGRGEACTKGRLRSEQVPQWLRRRNGEDGLTAARSAFSTAKLLCAKLADPAPAGAARGRGLAPAAAPGLSAGHGPPHVARGGGPAVGASPGLSAGHGPRRAARSGGPAVAADPSLSAGHGPMRAARGRGPAVAAELQWTCGQR